MNAHPSVPSFRDASRLLECTNKPSRQTSLQPPGTIHIQLAQDNRTLRLSGSADTAPHPTSARLSSAPAPKRAISASIGSDMAAAGSDAQTVPLVNYPRPISCNLLLFLFGDSKTYLTLGIIQVTLRCLAPFDLVRKSTALAGQDDGLQRPPIPVAQITSPQLP
ncbi:hypothetical protein FDECE_15702 [Fusarium decemcellulare]|nr:hypothetical protein FDECE_15702 [Fusarium decemcellulare]